MGRAVIYVFSGTGNTAMVADAYKEEFEQKGVPTVIYPLTSRMDHIPHPDGFDYTGLAYPIHGFNAPQIVFDFIRRLPSPSAEKKLFILKTSGEPLSLNNISSGKVQAMMKPKGFVLTNEYHYVMPYNMIFRHTDETAAKMWRTARRLCTVEAAEILEQKPHCLKKIPFGSFIAALFRIEHPAMKINGRFFTVSDSCIRCNRCIKNCPVENIYEQDGKFKFRGNCLMCTRCSFNCPVNAINIALLNGWKVNGPYRFTDPPAAQEDKHAGYCRKAYERYFADAERKIVSAGI